MPRPDIIWIVTTQWRAQAAGFAGDAHASTPNLDRLAKRALGYRQAVTPHPFGPFARAALLTGVLSPANGVADYFDPLPETARTIAHEMAALGYDTAFFGKWHLGKRDASAPLVGDVHARMVVPPEGRGGFEFWEAFESGFLLNDPWLHGTRLTEPVQFEGYQSDVVCERAAAWMQGRLEGLYSQGERPRFCVVSLEAPHPPYDAPAAGVEPRDPAALELSPNVPRGGEPELRARRELAGYYAHIEATDRAVGRFLEKIGEGAMVVFTSVHGDMHGAHGLFRKGWPYEESVRVPLLVALPGGVGEERDDAVSLVDLPALTKAFVATGSVPQVTVKAAHISMPSAVKLPHQCDRVWSGWRSKTAKEIFNVDGTPWLKFDLANDPFEQRNLVRAEE